MATLSSIGIGPAIGIDLGTTYSCVAVCENGVVTIIKNNLGQNTTPSYVAFPDPSLTNSTSIPSIKPIIGDSAKKQGNINPENIVYDVKRLIGRKFNDPVVQKDIKLWPFKVIGENNSPRIVVNGSSYHPEQISAKVLAYLKKQAEVHLGVPVTDAVITVPVYFNDGQRQATRDAGSIAGLNVLRIINEPTAAAIAYNHQLQQQTNPTGTNPLRKKNVLIFDLGGGTFDLALLTMEGENIELKAVDGDLHLGGQDFDNGLVDYCIQEFKKKDNIDLSQLQPNAKNPAEEKFDVGKRLRRLKNNCEMKKVNLSAAKVVTLSIEVIYESLDLKVKIKRETFESINKPLFDKCIAYVDNILRESNTRKEDVDDYVLVGGSSRIPKIQELLKNYFGGKAPCLTMRQDEAVAYGAAVIASSILSYIPPVDATKPNTHRTHQSSARPQPGENKLIPEVRFMDVNLRPECIGRGTFGTVYQGLWRKTKVAVKKFEDQKTMKSCADEIRQLSRLDHPNIIKLLATCEEHNAVYLIMEFADGGSVYGVLHNQPFAEVKRRERINWALQVAEGVAYLHGIQPKPIIHRDLKSANLLLLQENKVVKLADFGIAREQSASMTNNMGTARSMAPEVIFDTYTVKCDVYSFGIFLWELLTREKPFKDIKSEFKIKDDVRKGLRPSLTHPSLAVVLPTLTNLMKS